MYPLRARLPSSTPTQSGGWGAALTAPQLTRMAIFNNFNRYGPPCRGLTCARDIQAVRKSVPDDGGEARKRPPAGEIYELTPGVIRAPSFRTHTPQDEAGRLVSSPLFSGPFET